MGDLILLLGGARSGKSSLAEKMAFEIGMDSVLYVATAEGRDEEMLDRIQKHKAARPDTWETLEVPRKVAEVLQNNYKNEKVIILDCITLLAANLLPMGTGFEQVVVKFDEYENIVMAEIFGLLKFIEGTNVKFIVVSNEVGMGLVPAYELGRAFRDILGRVNKTLAEAAAEVYFLAAGIPLKLK